VYLERLRDGHQILGIGGADGDEAVQHVEEAVREAADLGSMR
jgi:hypothetical protein